MNKPPQSGISYRFVFGGRRRLQQPRGDVGRDRRNPRAQSRPAQHRRDPQLPKALKVLCIQCTVPATRRPPSPHPVMDSALHWFRFGRHFNCAYTYYTALSCVNFRALGCYSFSTP